MKVSAKTKVPSKWKDFLSNSTNKTELFDYLSTEVDAYTWTTNISVCITHGLAVVCKGNVIPMERCTHEEADTRTIQHVKHALEHGQKRIKIRTEDTDVVVILIGIFFCLLPICPDLQLFVAFGVGKNFCHYNINDLCYNHGQGKCHAFPAFYAFTGMDTTSLFFRKGKEVAWKTWKCYPEAIDTFAAVLDKTFDSMDRSSETFKTLECFTVLMYDKISSLESASCAASKGTELFKTYLLQK